MKEFFVKAGQRFVALPGRLWKAFISLLLWAFWIFLSFVIVTTLLGVLSYAWPGIMSVFPEEILEISEVVLAGWAGLLATFIVVSLVRGIRSNTRDIVEIWDNIKDGTVKKRLIPEKHPWEVAQEEARKSTEGEPS